MGVLITLKPCFYLYTERNTFFNVSFRPSKDQGLKSKKMKIWANQIYILDIIICFSPKNGSKLRFFLKESISIIKQSIFNLFVGQYFHFFLIFALFWFKLYWKAQQRIQKKRYRKLRFLKYINHGIKYQTIQIWKETI